MFFARFCGQNLKKCQKLKEICEKHLTNAQVLFKIYKSLFEKGVFIVSPIKAHRFKRKAKLREI